MKNLFLALALMLVSTFAFANEIKAPAGELVKIENVKIIISDVPYVISDLNNPKLNEILFDCTVEYDITIWMPGASGPIRIKGTTTVKGKSCMELLKEALK
jgi:hypothetical protein